MRIGLGKLKKRGIEEPTVNLTPLIDVVFVILIGFIIIAPLLELDKIELASAPKTSAPSPSVQESPISIHVHADNTIWYKNQKVSLPILYEAVRNDRIKYPKTVPQIFHDKKGYFGTYQDVKNILEEAGFEQVDVILKP